MKEVKEIHDVIIQEEINEELIDFARSLLNKNKVNDNISGISF